jgi:hypothetical protein
MTSEQLVYDEAVMSAQEQDRALEAIVRRGWALLARLAGLRAAHVREHAGLARPLSNNVRYAALAFVVAVARCCCSSHRVEGRFPFADRGGAR